ncbi:MAG: DUF819 family protein [Bacteroidota bacterium]
MLTAPILFTAILSIGFPFVAQWLNRQTWVPSFFSAVVLCYAFGMVVGNIVPHVAPELIVEKVAKGLAGAGMLIALPLLLFGANIKENWKLAGQGLVSFGLCCLAGLISTSIVAYCFRDSQEDGWQIAGMLTGLYTGGTPNVGAIGVAVGAPADYVVLLQAADILAGGIYLLMLMTVIHAFLGRFLPSFEYEAEESPAPASPEVPSPPPVASVRLPLFRRLLPTFISLAVAGAAAGITFAVRGGIADKDTTLLVLLLTTFSLALSLLPRINALPNTYPQGEYFLLIFCVALGLLANFAELFSKGLPLLAFSIFALVSSILLHWLLAWLFKIDRDMVMVSSTAAFYGPVFIAQITTTIPNQRLLAPGIALSLLGLAVGNYLGIAVAYFTQWIFSLG